MGVDGAAPDEAAELNELEIAIARETDAIEQLQHRTRVLRVEVAGWKPPRGERSNILPGLAGALLGSMTVVVIGVVLADVFR